MLWLSLIGLWVVLNGALLAFYGRDLVRLWREPYVRHPVLVLESDDWGAGPLQQAEALAAIARVLERHRDGEGRAASMTLALVLAVPDGDAIGRDGVYHRVDLGAPLFRPILDGLRQGEARGVFHLALHGLEHFRPATLMASPDAAVQTWLRAPAPQSSEDLPSPLQSRWVDTGSLPSRPLPATEVQAAAREEWGLFRQLLGHPPGYAVPPTFVWTRDVERAWRAEGLACMATPGWRYTCRGADALPDCPEGPLVPGTGEDGLTYLVRYEYFEPILGRGADHALGALGRAVAQARPCVLENHRNNFLGDVAIVQRSLDELDRLFSQAREAHPQVRFLSSIQLAEALRMRDAEAFITDWQGRLGPFLARLRELGRFWKLARLSGLAGLASLIARLVCPGAPGVPAQTGRRD